MWKIFYGTSVSIWILGNLINVGPFQFLNPSHSTFFMLSLVRDFITFERNQETQCTELTTLSLSRACPSSVSIFYVVPSLSPARVFNLPSSWAAPWKLVMKVSIPPHNGFTPFFTTKLVCIHEKLDGVGRVDNRPSTNKLHHFVQKKLQQQIVTCDLWHVTRDTWHMTHDTWHFFFWGGGEHSLKSSAP